MAAGDWAPDSTLRMGVVNVQTTTDGAVHHVGISYNVVAPSGSVLATRAYTWSVPTNHAKTLQLAMQALVADALASEGLTSAEYPTFPQ